MNELKSLFEIYRPALDREMKSVLKFGEAEPGSLYSLLHYHMGWLDKTFQPAQANPGKQIRPMLTLLTCQAAGGDWEQALPAAAAIEILHNFSLIHDDIEDGSQLRRGRETVWSIWGEPLAINAGDAMFTLARVALGRLSERGVAPTAVLQAFNRFDATCLTLTEGQHADMSFEARDDVTTSEYIEMITGKTSVLISLCAELGSLIAGADAETQTAYARFGLNLGLAFQIQDDILGIWGDEATIGKSATSDIETRKKTLPVLFGLEHSPTLQQRYQLPENGPEFVAETIADLNAVGAQEFSESQATAYSSTALEALQTASPSGSGAKALDQLTAMLLKRSS